MLFFILAIIGAERSSFDMAPPTYKQVYAQAIREGKSVLVGNKVDPTNLFTRADGEGKLSCLSDQFDPGITEIFPKNGKMYVKPAKTITEPSLKTAAPFQIQYQSSDYCPSCSRFGR